MLGYEVLESKKKNSYTAPYRIIGAVLPDHFQANVLQQTKFFVEENELLPIFPAG